MAFRARAAGGSCWRCAGMALAERRIAGGAAQAPRRPPADDPFTWLEEIQGERALAWARNENDAHARRAPGRSALPAMLRPGARDPAGARPHPGRHASGPTASTISGRTPTMSAASSAAPPSPATAPTIPPGRRCSTSTRWPRPRRQIWVYQGMQLPAARGAALPGLPLRRRPRRQCRARIRPARAPLRRGRLQPARGQAERRLGGREHDPGRARLGAGDDDRVRLSVRRSSGCGAARRSTRPRRSIAARPRTCGSAPFVLRDSDGRVHGDRRLSRPRLLPQRVHPVPPRRQRHAAASRSAPRSAGIVDGRLLVSSTRPGSRRRACASRPIRSSPTISPNGSAIR